MPFQKVTLLRVQRCSLISWLWFHQRPTLNALCLPNLHEKMYLSACSKREKKVQSSWLQMFDTLHILKYNSLAHWDFLNPSSTHSFHAKGWEYTDPNLEPHGPCYIQIPTHCTTGTEEWASGFTENIKRFSEACWCESHMQLHGCFLS